MPKAELTDIGPVEHITLELPDGGGVTVFRGRNGVGKTTALRAVEDVLKEKGTSQVEARDQCQRGVADAFGCRMTVSRTTRRTGELEVESLEGKFDLADLVDPGVIDVDKADATRIKALVQLSGVQPDMTDFHKLVGGEEKWDKLVSSATANTKDIVTLAARTKRDLEAAARKLESEADMEEGHAKGCEQAMGELDLDAPHDEKLLANTLEARIRQEAELKSQRSQYESAAELRSQAQTELAEAEKNYKGPTAAETEKDIALIEREISDLQAKLTRKQHDLELAKNALEAARDHEQSIAGWRKALENQPPNPTDEELAAAAEATAKARRLSEMGVLIREARAQREQAELHREEANRLRDDAQRLRDAAKSTDDILSDAVARTGSRLRVEGGRLVLDTDRGKGEYFAELSDGERWKEALDIAIEVGGEGCLLVIEQSAWEGLDDINRKAINQHAKDRKVWILTAEATTDETITAEAMN